MNDWTDYAEIGWEWTVFVFESLWSHIPRLLLYTAIGFSIGVVLSILLYRFLKRKNVFQREGRLSLVYRIWAVIYKMAFVCCLMGFALSISTMLAARKSTKIEVDRAVDVLTDNIAYSLFKVEGSRAKLEQAYDFVYEAGQTVDMTNELLVQLFTDQYLSGQENWFVSKFGGSSVIERAVVAAEKEILYLLFNYGLAKSGMDGSSISKERFDKGFDIWLDGGYHDSMPDVKDLLMKWVWKYLGPAVNGIFIPWILSFFALAFFPLLERWIFKKIRARKLKKEALMDA